MIKEYSKLSASIAFWKRNCFNTCLKVFNSCHEIVIHDMFCTSLTLITG